MKKPLTELFQPQVYVRVTVSRFMRKPEELWIPFVCRHVFCKPEEAQAFLPTYIEWLIEQKAVTKEVAYTADGGKVNESNLKTVIVPLQVLALELVDPSEDGRGGASLKDEVLGSLDSYGSSPKKEVDDSDGL